MTLTGLSRSNSIRDQRIERLVELASPRALIEEHRAALPRLHFPEGDVADPAGTSAGEPGHLVFDDPAVLLELIDTVEGEDPRETSIKRFPLWGDAAPVIDTPSHARASVRLYGSRYAAIAPSSSSTESGTE